MAIYWASPFEEEQAPFTSGQRAQQIERRHGDEYQNEYGHYRRKIESAAPAAPRVHQVPTLRTPQPPGLDGSRAGSQLMSKTLDSH